MIDRLATQRATLFAPGRRVRIQVSGECHLRQRATSLSTGVDHHTTQGHPVWHDGRVGRIIAMPDILVGRFVEGHDICVLFDEAYQAPFYRSIGGAFAPQELTPLEEDGTEIVHPALAQFRR